MNNVAQPSYMLVPSGSGLTAGREKPVTIAPLTATLAGPPQVIPLTKSHLASLQAVSLPQNYNVMDKLKGKYRPTIMDQKKCGSCWAFSCASSIGDILTLDQLKNNNKNLKGYIEISPTSIMLNCYGQKWSNECTGGDPTRVLQFLSSEHLPVTLNRCVDYSWYSQWTKKTGNCQMGSTNLCSGKGQNGYLSMLATSDNGQSPLACFFPTSTGSHWQFYIKSGTSNEPTQTNQSISNTFSNIGITKAQSLGGKLSSENALSQSKINILAMKNHIYQYGSLVGGMPVHLDFFSGGNEKMMIKVAGKSTAAPYKSWWHGKNNDIYVQDKSSPPKGGHALTIVGWGQDETLKNEFPSGSGEFWWVRNSWGETWGKQKAPYNGYFKLAMYPTNLKSEFSLFWMASPTDFGGLWGGCKADSICGGPSLRCSTPLGSLNLNWPSFDQPKKFYETPGDLGVAASPASPPGSPGSSGSPSPTTSSSLRETLIIVGCVLLGLFLLLAVVHVL